VTQVVHDRAQIVDDRPRSRYTRPIDSAVGPARFCNRLNATMVSRYGYGAALVFALTLGAASPARTASATPAATRSVPGALAHTPPAAPAEGRSDPSAQPQVSQDAAARARMHECAHQWSSIKKAGNAGATTWKEFSATCLVVSR
jgi:hypothetical protein